MLNIRTIKKDTLYTVMLQQLYSLNYMWLRFEGFMQEKIPEVYGSEEYYQLFEDYGSEEARRLVKALGFPREEVKELTRFLKYSHWAIFENIEIAELTANSFRMRTLDCSAQSAAKKWGMEYYDCGTGGLRIRSELEACGFAAACLKVLTLRQRFRGFLPRLKPDLKVHVQSFLASGWFH
jgi:hypothetical protein